MTIKSWLKVAHLLLQIVAVGGLLFIEIAAAETSNNWNSYLTPFSANSLWNSRPVNPKLGKFVIPESKYYPAVSEGAYSTGTFLSNPGDDAVTVTGLPNQKGLWNADTETYQDITIPRWPKNVIPASGLDGHADIFDPIDNIIHSFFKLRNIDGQWMAKQYAWTKLNGRGWGDPAHYFQGARATGVPTSAGLIRKHEIDDGDTLYRHALAMSLTFNALSANPGYMFPATSADSNAVDTNTGGIPEGALMMLPESFDTNRIDNPDLRKIAETLKVYGAYVVDRNHGTPFSIYVENGSGFNLHGNGWDNKVAADLQTIRASLRQVESVAGWLDGNGQPFTPENNLNLLSMRGQWQRQSGNESGYFDSWKQAIRFPVTAIRTVMVNYNNRGISYLSWAGPEAGKKYKLTAVTTGGGALRLAIYDKSTKAILFDSGELENDDSVELAWPTSKVAIIVYAISGTGEPSSVRGELLSLSE